MTDNLRTLAEAEVAKRRMFIDDDELTMFVEGFIAGRTSGIPEALERIEQAAGLSMCGSAPDHDALYEEIDKMRALLNGENE